MLERRLDNSNYERSVDTENDTDSDTDIDTDNDTLIQKVTWNEYGLQSTYGDMNSLQ